jgi:hypothetical protein
VEGSRFVIFSKIKKRQISVRPFKKKLKSGKMLRAFPKALAKFCSKYFSAFLKKLFFLNPKQTSLIIEKKNHQKRRKTETFLSESKLSFCYTFIFFKLMFLKN